MITTPYLVRYNGRTYKFVTRDAAMSLYREFCDDVKNRLEITNTHLHPIAFSRYVQFYEL